MIMEETTHLSKREHRDPGELDCEVDFKIRKKVKTTSHNEEETTAE